MPSKAKTVVKARLEERRKRKKAAADDPDMSLGDSKKTKLAANPGPSKDGCNAKVTSIQ